nr:hypothetical protein [Providencia sp. M-27]
MDKLIPIKSNHAVSASEIAEIKVEGNNVCVVMKGGHQYLADRDYKQTQDQRYYELVMLINQESHWWVLSHCSLPFSSPRMVQTVGVGFCLLHFSLI